MGFASTDHREPKKHFDNFKLSGVKESVNHIWGCVWIAVVGELWKHRNEMIFKGGRIDHNEIFTLVQLKVWSWVRSKAREIYFSFSDWCLEPLVCIKCVKHY